MSTEGTESPGRRELLVRVTREYPGTPTTVRIHDVATLRVHAEHHLHNGAAVVLTIRDGRIESEQRIP